MGPTGQRVVREGLSEEADKKEGRKGDSGKSKCKGLEVTGA